MCEFAFRAHVAKDKKCEDPGDFVLERFSSLSGPRIRLTGILSFIEIACLILECKSVRHEFYSCSTDLKSIRIDNESTEFRFQEIVYKARILHTMI